MKKTITPFTIAVLAVVVCTIAWTAVRADDFNWGDDQPKTTVAKEKKPMPRTVTGRLDGVYDEDDKLVGVSIWDDASDDEFVVVMDAKGKELLKQVDKRVKLTGTAVADGEGQLQLTVKTVEVLKDEDVVIEE